MRKAIENTAWDEETGKPISHYETEMNDILHNANLPWMDIAKVHKEEQQRAARDELNYLGE